MQKFVDFIKAAKESELEWISRLDYGSGCQEHFLALNKLIFAQNCIGNSDQLWYPLEVVELGSHGLQQGKEREFVICTLLAIVNYMDGPLGYIDLDMKLNERAADYDALPGPWRDLIVQAYLCCGL